MSIYENVCEYADKKHMTIAELEKRAELSNGTIGKWRYSSPTVSNLSKVAKELGIKPAALLKEREK